LFCLILVCSLSPINKLSFLLKEELFFGYFKNKTFEQNKAFKFINASKEKNKLTQTAKKRPNWRYFRLIWSESG
jgi:hypothetical protein